MAATACGYGNPCLVVGRRCTASQGMCVCQRMPAIVLVDLFFVAVTVA